VGPAAELAALAEQAAALVADADDKKRNWSSGAAKIPG